MLEKIFLSWKEKKIKKIWKIPKKNVKKIFNYPTKKVIDLILNINDYKNFLPWCNESIIHSTEEKKNYDIITADLEIGYKIFSDTYSSKVIYDKKKNIIEVSCLARPVKTLSNIWKIKKINNNKCEVNFFIEIELKNKMLNQLLNKFFDLGFEKILNSFESYVKKTIIK